jgi:hypothetical protein
MTAPIIRKPLHVSRVEAATIYEGLVMLSFFAAKNPDRVLPYNVRSIDVLKDRVIDEAWPELRSTYRGNRQERRYGR